MRVVATLMFSLAVLAVKILLSNDDGWAEVNIRAFYDALTASSHSVVISAPAQNKSGSGPSDAPPEPVSSGCEFASCPPNSPPTGSNSSNLRFNYVNSYPATSVRYGLETSKPFFNGYPDLVVTGPNVGSNLDIINLISGTVGAAQFATWNAGVPAIAFSGRDGDHTAWNVRPVPRYSTIYAALATKVVNTLTMSGGGPFLPWGVFVNVNFPSVGHKRSCTSADQVKFVLTRSYATSDPARVDFTTCGGQRLPTERSVIQADGCYGSISVANASKTFDSSVANQADVHQKLGPILSCFV